jgi:hypothetical protein|tara:strand:+ start:174 stop:590 length:417 start_codon:yes stop_codon:yes gene_type:complete
MESKVIKDKPTYSVITENEVTTEKNGMMTPVGYIEQHYPQTAKEFKRLQKEQYELFCKKQMDYGPSNIAMGTDLTTNEQKRLSLIGLIVRINDKVQRLINLVIKNNREAQNEPTIDAFKDLACYGIIAQIVKNGKWGK